MTRLLDSGDLSPKPRFDKRKLRGPLHHNFGKRYPRKGKVSKQLLSLEDSSAAWVAGYLEGEGSFILEHRRNIGSRMYMTARVSANSTDHDVLIRLQSLVGGTINFQGRRTESHKDQWKWCIYGYEAAAILYDRISPWLGERRSSQFQSVVAACEKYREELSADYLCDSADYIGA